MPAPKTFTPATAGAEPFQTRPGDHVVVYRFGDQAQGWDWLSRLRQGSGGNFAKPADNVLNDWALKQSSYGSKSEGIEGNPFISVATDFQSLYDNGEVWVQSILRTVATLGVFVVPYDTLYRPSPTKLISKSETEWLFYDGDHDITHYLDTWRPNPMLAQPESVTG